MLSNAITIRDATQKDVAATALLMTDLGYPATVVEMQTRYKSISTHPYYRTLLAISSNEEVAGMIGLIKSFYFEHNGMYLRIRALVVSKDYRNMGIGTKLMAAAEMWATEIGAHDILLTSGNRDERKPAFAFYQQLGFEITSSGFVKKLR